MANTDITLTQSMANTKASTPNLDFFGERVVSHPNEVPDFVRSMHQRLVSNAPPDDKMLMDILRLTEAHATDVTVTLLRCAPSCDRFAVQTVRALFRHLRCLDLLVSMERKCGWDTLLCADTHHYAVGLLAREMHRTLNPLCSCIALRLLGLLSTQKPCWDLPALAFLVEVLECHDMKEWSDSVLEIISRRLQSKSMEMRRLALRGLVVLSKDPSVAEGIRSLTQSLMGLLQDADGEVVALILSIFLNELQDRATLISSPTALQLAEALQLLFDHDNSHVQLLSICLFREVMEVVTDKGKKPLKKHVSKSLLSLFFHCHDENQHVAEASRETLLCAAKFLKRRHLKQLVKKEQPWRFSEHLVRTACKPGRGAEPAPSLPSCRSLQLAEDRSRAAEHLHQALPYLENSQEPLREAATRFIGRYLKRQPEELELICKVSSQGAANPETAVKESLLIPVRALRALINLGGPDQPLPWDLYSASATEAQPWISSD
ncbi:hypothetical protein HGM15179_014631 [Zosterops borbonicus]|uniref:Maestro/Maestro-like HEAT-repeats domain-containing protein n=1 Tax=Zosterops borbonicus TaxID=364589 RepID=A0A8K1LG07_9PASS|nr:hypothetical protein HGM15179_014631 [Zosterops borbonicus]